ncbi:unnamed protein product [Laminaria digitata]
MSVVELGSGSGTWGCEGAHNFPGSFPGAMQEEKGSCGATTPPCPRRILQEFSLRRRKSPGISLRRRKRIRGRGATGPASLSAQNYPGSFHAGAGGEGVVSNQ